MASSKNDSPGHLDTSSAAPLPEPPGPVGDEDASYLAIEDQHSNDYSLWAVALVFVVPSLGGFLFGYDIAATSFVLRALTEPTSETGWSDLIAASAAWQGTVVALASAGALISSGLLFWQQDSLGRRTELQLGALLYIVGATLEYAADSLADWLGFAIFVLGRMIYGLGIGVSMHAAPTYLGEMGPSSIRGILVSLKEACIVLGIVMGYTLGNTFGSHWRWTYVCSVLPAVAMLVLATYAIPESCRWLLLQSGQQHGQDAALKSLQFVFPRGPVAAHQLASMQRALEQEGLIPQAPSSSLSAQQGPENERSSLLLPAPVSAAVEPTVPSSVPSLKDKSTWLLLQPKYRGPLIAGFGLVVLQQVTGQPSVLSYATQIFRRAGVTGSATIAVSLFKLVATLVAAGTVEYYGRVRLLKLGCSLMLVALILLTATFGGLLSRNTTSATDTEDDQEGTGGLWSQLVTLGAMFLYIGGYQVGFGPITWLLTSEIFPLTIRGAAVAVAVQLNFLLNAVVQFGVPVLQQWLGLASTFGIFAILNVVRYVRPCTPVPVCTYALDQV